VGEADANALLFNVRGARSFTVTCLFHDAERLIDVQLTQGFVSV